LIIVLGTVIAFGVLALVLAHRRAQFGDALMMAPIWMLSIAVLLQLTSLVTRTEAWNLCVHAAGGSVERRVVFRAGGVGSLGSVLSGQLGSATRIAALRRAAPQTSPRLPALITAEVPTLAVEAVLAAIFTFTLVGPLGLPVWVPILVVALMACVVTLLATLARRRRGLWMGLAVLRDLRGRRRLVAMVIIGVLAQIARNWLVLRAVGVDASILSAIAVLIVTVSLSALPMGPSVGATAAVLILGAHGVAATAAGGLLLTVTGTAGALCFAGWACGDRVLAGLRNARLAPVPIIALGTAGPPR
jgi:uncharacterized membrane protein YbhN (UPF0104 family)